MQPAGSHLASAALVAHRLGHKHRIAVARAERLELLEYAEKLRGNLGKLDLRIDVHYRGKHITGNLALDKLVHTPCELRKVLFLEGKPGRIDVPTEILQQVSAALNGSVQVKPGNAAG